MNQLQRHRRCALVVSCSNGKTLEPAPGLLIRNLAGRGDRAAVAWCSQLAAEARRRPLRSLYKGQQWQSCLSLAASARAIRDVAVDLWIVSAGLGLRSADDEAPPYGASFTSGPDCVGRTLSQRRAWWEALRAMTRTPGLDDLRRRYDELVVVLSPAYLQVVGPELARVDDENLLIMTSAPHDHPRVALDTNLKAALGGSASTLNQKAAEKLIAIAQDRPLGRVDVLKDWEAWATPCRASDNFDRHVLDDAAVGRLVRTWAREGPTSASGLLRRLRDSGYACEQGRFARIYRQTLGEATS